MVHSAMKTVQERIFLSLPGLLFICDVACPKASL